MTFAYFRAPVGWIELTRRTIRDTIDDGCPGLAAQLAFYFFLALFPALLFVVSLLGYLPIEPALQTMILRLEGLLPQQVLTLIRDQLDRVVAGASGGLLTFGIAGAVWSSSSAIVAIIDALNHAYDIEERRPWWKARLIAMGLTIALAVFVVTAFALVVGGTDLAVWLAGLVGVDEAFTGVWALGQWLVALALVVIAVDLVYYLAPNVDFEWAWVTPGALVATGLWLLASIGFRTYVQNFSNYSDLYGAIGGVIVLMLWFYLCGFALLIGAELNAEIEKALRAA